MNHKNIKVKNTYQNKLDKILNEFSLDPKTTFIISDTSIKNNVTTSISHIYNGHNIIAKILHYTTNIIFIEVEIFSIRYEINQAVQVSNIKQIIIITNTISAIKHIFNLFSYSFYLHSITVFQDLKAFFNKNSKNSNNIIFFWDCSSSNKWPPYLADDKETK